MNDFVLKPHSPEAEQALLGALLHNNLAFERVADFLRPEHFSDPSHSRIYEAISTLISRGHIADPITLKEYFDRDDALSEVGGGQYLAQLAASVISIINTEDYGRKIHDFYLRDDKRPQLSDLRESGSIEQDSDVVMFVYREEYYLARKKPTGSDDKIAEWERSLSSVANIAEVIIAKQRHGPISDVKLHFEGRLTKFSDLATS